MSKYLVLAIAALFLPTDKAFAQSQPTPTNAIEIQRISAEKETFRSANTDDLRQRMENAGLAHAVAERQAELRRDTEKLVSLTAELKQNVDKTGTNILSMDVIKKAAEIRSLPKAWKTR